VHTRWFVLFSLNLCQESNDVVLSILFCNTLDILTTLNPSLPHGTFLKVVEKEKFRKKIAKYVGLCNIYMKYVK